MMSWPTTTLGPDARLRNSPTFARTKFSSMTRLIDHPCRATLL